VRHEILNEPCGFVFFSRGFGRWKDKTTLPARLLQVDALEDGGHLGESDLYSRTSRSRWSVIGSKPAGTRRWHESPKTCSSGPGGLMIPVVTTGVVDGYGRAGRRAYQSARGYESVNWRSELSIEAGVQVGGDRAGCGRNEGILKMWSTGRSRGNVANKLPLGGMLKYRA
jgi:hypothetical protein